MLIFVKRSSDDMEDKKLEERLEERNKSIFDFLSDLNRDRKTGSIIQTVINFLLLCTVIGMAIGMVYMGIHCQNKIAEQAEKSEKRIYEFISEYDFATSYNLDTGTIVHSDESGNINFNQR